MAHHGTKIEGSERPQEDGYRYGADDHPDLSCGARNQVEAFESGVESAIAILVETITVLWVLGSMGD